MKSNTRQKGVASIYFAFVAVAILGVGALAIEGARYITDKAQFGDVMEATAIAISESDDLRDDKGFNQQQANTIARNWVSYLIPDIRTTEFSVSRSKKTYEIEVPFGLPVVRTLHNYQISGTTTKESWLHMQDLPSFEREQKVANRATAARIRADFEPVDVVFVSDFSGSMKGGDKLKELKKAIRSVTTTIFDATEKLKEKHPREEIKDSSFGFVPFTKRIVVERNGKYYCSSMLRPPGGTIYERPMQEQRFSYMARLQDRDDLDSWFIREGYSRSEEEVARKYLRLAEDGNEALDCNKRNRSCWRGYKNHISFSRTASDLQLKSQYVLSTPMDMGYWGFNSDRYCYHKNGKPYYYNIDRKPLESRKNLDDFNHSISTMRAEGGTHMYQGLLAAPAQFEKATNKNRFIFVLSDGEENTGAFRTLVQNGLCTNIRKKMSVNANGEQTKFEMFVIGLKFNNKDDWAYRQCFGKHIYEVRNLNKLNDVIMELLSSTASYNVER